MKEEETLLDSYFKNVRQIQFEKDLAMFKQTEHSKQKEIRQKIQQIDQVYEKKTNLLKAQKKIKRSSFINEMRMKKSRLKYEMCEQIFDEVLQSLIKISDEGQLDYQLILINYIVQGCIRMFQPEVKVHVLQKDLHTVRILVPDILKSFQYFVEEAMGLEVQLDLIIVENDCLQSRNFLKPLDKNQQNRQAVGGVILTDVTGNIVYKNTFDTRLNILKQNSLPIIRNMIWHSELKSET